MLGFVIGAASGVLQFRMLAGFTAAVTGGGFDTRAVILGIVQFFIPLVVLLGCAFLLREELLWAGLGMAASLIGCSAARFIRQRRK